MNQTNLVLDGEEVEVHDDPVGDNGLDDADGDPTQVLSERPKKGKTNTHETDDEDVVEVEGLDDGEGYEEGDDGDDVKHALLSDDFSEGHFFPMGSLRDAGWDTSRMGCELVDAEEEDDDVEDEGEGVEGGHEPNVLGHRKRIGGTDAVETLEVGGIKVRVGGDDANGERPLRELDQTDKGQNDGVTLPEGDGAQSEGEGGDGGDGHA